MSAEERTGFVLAIPLVIQVVVGAWKAAVGAIQLIGPGSGNIINNVIKK